MIDEQERGEERWGGEEWIVIDEAERHRLFGKSVIVIFLGLRILNP